MRSSACLVLLLLSLMAVGQQDSGLSSPDSVRNFKKALRLSALYPGLGQVYNKQYWKAPLFAAGFSAGVVATAELSKENSRFRQAQLRTLTGEPCDLGPPYCNLDLADLLKARTRAKQRFNAALVGTAFVYMTNLLDAYTDARLTALPPGHQPARAAALAVLLPGAGQWYNRKLWKVPIVYAALGTSIGFVIYNTSYYYRYRDAYVLRTDGDPSTVDEFSSDPVLGIDQNLAIFRDAHRENRDLSYFAVALVYALSVIDAIVDAHLIHFDISDDLSSRLIPTIGPEGKQLTLSLSF